MPGPSSMPLTTFTVDAEDGKEKGEDRTNDRRLYGLGSYIPVNTIIRCYTEHPKMLWPSLRHRRPPHHVRLHHLARSPEPVVKPDLTKPPQVSA